MRDLLAAARLVRFCVVPAAVVMLWPVGPVAAGTSQTPVVASSCYDQQQAATAVDGAFRSPAEESWLASDSVQMTLRQISLLVDAERSLHGYQIHTADQKVAVVHAQLASPSDVLRVVEQAMARASADVSGSSALPRIVVYPACRVLTSAPHFDELEESIATVRWTDEPAFELVGIALDRDLAATQVVVTMEDANDISSRLSARLVDFYGEDVRVVVNPDHPKFLPTLALSAADNDASSATTTAAPATGTGPTTTAERAAGVVQPVVDERAGTGQDTSPGGNLENRFGSMEWLTFSGAVGLVGAGLTLVGYQRHRRRGHGSAAANGDLESH